MPRCLYQEPSHRICPSHKYRPPQPGDHLKHTCMSCTLNCSHSSLCLASQMSLAPQALSLTLPWTLRPQSCQARDQCCSTAMALHIQRPNILPEFLPHPRRQHPWIPKAWLEHVCSSWEKGSMRTQNKLLAFSKAGLIALGFLSKRY